MKRKSKKQRLDHALYLWLIGILFFLLSGVLFFLSSTHEAALPLLAVAGEVPENATNPHAYLFGSLAQLEVTIKPGEGRVYVDTFPLTKLDTVISTRLAKEFACDFLKKDCSVYDFYYTITSNSQVIGGPSAGAAMAVATIAALEDLSLQPVAITGTINSGGVIGVVGGIKQKIDAAAENSLSLVLIPKYEAPLKLAENLTLDPVTYGQLQGITVKEVATIEEALWYATGKNFSHPQQQVFADEAYKEKMQQINQQLCGEALQALNETLPYYNFTPESLFFLDFLLEEVNQTILQLLNQSSKDHGSFENASSFNASMVDGFLALREGLKKVIAAQQNTALGRYYSSASFCFGAAIDFAYSKILHEHVNMTLMKEHLLANITSFERQIQQQPLFSLNDLQTMMIVQERLGEAKQLLNETTLYSLVFAIYRFKTAQLWATFYEGKQEEGFQFDDLALARSCAEKIAEVNERMHYLQMFFPFSREVGSNELEVAQRYQQEERYGLCLFSASKARAEIDVVLSLFGLNQTNAKQLLQEKLSLIKKKIAEQEGFPLLAYSYYEYATALQDTDVSSALLYAEYSLALADLKIYFPQYQKRFLFNIPLLRALFLGLALGFILSAWFVRK